jgi:hypothetical protein
MCPAHGARCGRGLSPHKPPQNHDRSKLCCLQSCSAEVKNRIFACRIREQIIINSLGGGGVRGGLHPPPWHKLPITPNTPKDLLYAKSISLYSPVSLAQSKKAQNRKHSERPGRMLRFISMS